MLVGTRAVAGKVSLTNHIAAPGPVVRADEMRIKQVMLNLVTNAVKFTPPGGRVSVAADVDDTGCCRIVVTDTGIGIAAGDIEKVLSVFGQAEGSWTRRHEGAGLGLPLAVKLVEQHGGTLSLDSEIGTGTTVTVRLPAARTTG